jgi:hypothetical protein
MKAVMTFDDVTHILGVSLDDAYFLEQIGVLRPRNVWALSPPTFDQAAVERCRSWLAGQAQEPGGLIARLRAEHDAEMINPDGLVRPDRVGCAWTIYGQYAWQREVGAGLGPELLEVLHADDVEPLEDVALLPPEWRQPTDFFPVTPDQLIHFAVFIGEGAGTWAVGKTLDGFGSVLARAARRNSKYWKKQVARAFWFVISIWHGAGRFWAVIAFDVSPEHVAEYALIEPAYQAILRGRRRGSKKTGADQPAAGPGQPDRDSEAIVAIVRGGRLRPPYRRFPNLDAALRGLGRVHEVSSGGPLEALWNAAHPRSSSGLRLCQALQSRPGRLVLSDQLAREAKCSKSTARDVLRELTAMGAPLRHEPARGWIYDRGGTARGLE